MFLFCVIVRWIIEVTGAPGTLYANETYKLQVDFPEHYPMESPQATFLISFFGIYMKVLFFMFLPAIKS